MSTPISTWKQRLAACFRKDQRAMHVLGIPAAIGTAVAAAFGSWLSPEVGLSLGLLSAGLGTSVAGFYVVSGFDHRLEALLGGAHVERQQQLQSSHIEAVLDNAPPELRPTLESILSHHAAIEAEFDDGETCAAEEVLKKNRDRLTALRDRALSMIGLWQRLRRILDESNTDRLVADVVRIKNQLAKTSNEQTRTVLTSALESAQRTLHQRQTAEEKCDEVRGIITMIDANIREFKLTMELRKTDAAMSQGAAVPEVSELQERLIAANQACDELLATDGQSRRTVAKDKLS